MRAAELGIKSYSWWPDWRDECAAIVASGPTIKKMDLDCLKDRIHALVIKETWKRCPWAEVLYGCDAPWWMHNKGVPGFKGIKLCHGAQATAQYEDVHKVNIKMVDEILTEEPLLVGNGGNSGFQALNLLVQFGVKNVILVGFDLHDRGGVHWYGRNTAPGMNNPMKVNFDRWRRGYEAVKKRLKELGVEVINTSPESDLHVFKNQSLEDTMREWGL
jgi:hypothetical protein